ncbi:NAD(P)/FAD-dependent oxidoreductase [Paracidovorax citrulli]|uniref:NAD(P)/FAD-dependent oxidoreductase n=1 Tax=Paracidovorax citrulli TaxID=80869 RepID=UPI0002E7D9A1|nr:NAD(P)/FAD-dependent oxidoreductase [Paracidovorax citrulli]QCX09103.1 L-2-hydroxyglutarate oxidase LhgO [Paracidovorax citrulli]UEG48311.1 NAD(P)/FAD-dependent oxidoreductase [Paracidovorax citrulli]UMT88479.1 NAD(P)/FAD-dependent oxidoreductase [Paracidovorax citrulli]UMT96431.1 NAD(P)/FAD-dependent oxidoreductase [Paracidovorax citrulli]WIY32605.1 NAD(P)/FAD-dependent oxidoreductase [Paracidovorax citrulli]
MSDAVECVVIGAGVVGLAVARALAMEGREVLVLEAAGAIGTGTSSRNSEVIHAGIYYPQGSLKARLCVQGRELLYAYCAQRGVPHRRCGKLIVATSSSQFASLDGIAARARANGVSDLQRLGRDEAVALEPALACAGALLSPSTGIVDSHALMLALQGDLEHAGGIVALNSAFSAAQCGSDGILLQAEDGTKLLARCVINAAGLQAPAVARRFAGMRHDMVPAAYYAKGSYFSYSGRAPFSRLVYPVPEAAGLGVHLTLDLGGQARFGPDVEWVSESGDLAVDPARGQAFYAEVRKYWPALQDGALQPAYAGMRPKIHGPHEPAADFVVQGPGVHGVPGLVHLYGIESPGLTSCLAIAEYVTAAARG